MPHFLIMLLKINLVLILFAAAYYLILRRLTFYTINRIFLVFGIFFSTIYPFIDLTDFFHHQQQLNPKVIAFVPQLNQSVKAIIPSKLVDMNWQLLSLIFYVGVVLMAVRLAIQFISLYKMHQKSKPGLVGDDEVRILNEQVSPFSFWQTVYINPALHQEQELQTILAHEKIHVKEWHSLDIILAELSVVFYWFNPGVWLMKKAVKENLEFITDEKILKRGMDKKTYQYSLLDVGNLTPAAAIVNNFNLSDLKKRIKMMNAKRSSRLTLSRYLFLLPVLLVTTLVFTVSGKELNKQLIPLKNAITFKIKSLYQPAITPTVKEAKKIKRNTLVKLNKVADSAAKSTYFIERIMVKTDTSDFDVRALEKFESIRAAVKQLVINDGASKAFIAIKDTANNGNAYAKIEQLKIAFKGKNEALPAVEGAKRNMIIIRTNSKDNKSTDSTATQLKNFFLNGKRLSSEKDLEQLKNDEIKDIHVARNLDKTEFYIFSKKNPEKSSTTKSSGN